MQSTAQTDMTKTTFVYVSWGVCTVCKLQNSICPEFLAVWPRFLDHPVIWEPGWTNNRGNSAQNNHVTKKGLGYQQSAEGLKDCFAKLRFVWCFIWIGTTQCKHVMLRGSTRLRTAWKWCGTEHGFRIFTSMTRFRSKRELSQYS